MCNGSRRISNLILCCKRATIKQLVSSKSTVVSDIYLYLLCTARSACVFDFLRWMRARESSGSDVVSLRGSQTCWDSEMRPGYWLTTGQLQVSRPMLWLRLKNKLTVWRVCTLEKGVQMGYRQSHFLWCSIYPHQPSVITQQRPWDVSYVS